MNSMLIGPMLLAGLNVGIKEAQLDQITEQVVQLRSASPSDRTQARRQLMEIGYEQLPELRYVITHMSDLHPSQTDPVYDVVQHVFIRDRLMKLPRAKGAMLGISLQKSVMLRESVSTERSIYNFGVEFDLRPGQIANRYLEEGDLILAVGQSPYLSATPSTTDLIDRISKCSAGQHLTLLIQRGPARMHVEIPLDPRFAEMDSSDSQFFSTYSQATEDAERYWNQYFANLFENDAL